MLDEELFRIERMEEITEWARRDNLTDYDRAAIYGAAWALADALFDRIENAADFDRGYAREKLRKWRNGLATVVGFDDPMGHPRMQHWSDACGQLDSFRNTVLSPD